jgi:hypothetical protein
MRIYKHIEDEYSLAIKQGVADTDDDKEKLVGWIIDHNHATSPEVSNNVRQYFQATGTLDGLTEWYAATIGDSDNG